MEGAQFLKDDAESKFKEQDFEGALWLANMAESLCPDLQGIQQYIAAYSVHVAAYESNITTITARTYGNNVTFTKVKVPDWYKVLDIEDDLVDSGDLDMDDIDAIIKKRYKRMALLVHPDKNDSVAAESAFKLVQDALEILSDPDKREQFEMKRHYSRPQPPSPAPSKQKNSKSRRRKPKPPVNQDERFRFKEKIVSRHERNYKIAQLSSNDNDCEADDAWYSHEEEEAGEESEEMKTEVRLCPTCGYPRDAKINEKVCFSVLHCGYCDREFRFSKQS